MEGARCQVVNGRDKGQERQPSGWRVRGVARERERSRETAREVKRDSLARCGFTGQRQDDSGARASTRQEERERAERARASTREEARKKTSTLVPR
jgi:hypothetical protein